MSAWSVGTAQQFYTQVSLPPELRFDGVNDSVDCGAFGAGNFSLSANFVYGGVNQLGVNQTLFSITTTQQARVYIWPNGQVHFLHLDSGANFIDQTFTHFNLLIGVEYLITVSFISGTKTITINGTSVVLSGQTLMLPVGQPTILVGSTGSLFFKGCIKSFSTNNYSYIQQGDQSATTLVPSHPSGADGTLVGGASWQYTGIVGNYLTVALVVSAITASNPTEPITIYILDRSTDVSGIPETINGQPVTVQYSYAPPVQTGSIFPKCRCTISIGV